MPRALITGIGGFVGPYLRTELEAAGYDIFGLERKPSQDPKVAVADITQPDQVRTVVADIRPDLIFHLAGFSSVAKSWEERELVDRINVGGTENLLRSAATLAAPPRVLIVSSAEAYGLPAVLPLTEDQPLKAVSPYGQSRRRQEESARKLYNNVVISRSFNHSGPGQPPAFVVPSFIQQALRVKHGLQPAVLVGNLEAVRDFTDVRDVVRAYRLIVEHGTAGEVYNVCSGIGRRISDILSRILKETELSQAAVQVDPSRLHPSDIPILVGSNLKVSVATGWKPTFDFLDTTIKDSVHYAEQTRMWSDSTVL